MIHKTRQHILTAFAPSTLGVVMTFMVSSFTVALVCIKSFGSQGVVQQGLFVAGHLTGPSYHQLTDRLSENIIVSNASTFIFWAAVGLIVYLLASSIMAALSNEVKLGKELQYVNTQRSQIIRYKVTKAATRAVVLGGWVLYMQLFFNLLLPYSLAAAYAARLENPLQQIAQLLTSILLLFLSLHLHIVFLRLLLLKTRVFGEPEEG